MVTGCVSCYGCFSIVCCLSLFSLTYLGLFVLSCVFSIWCLGYSWGYCQCSLIGCQVITYVMGLLGCYC
jgi:hypothetical protein